MPKYCRAISATHHFKDFGPLERITGTKLTDGVTPVEGVPGWVATDVGALKAAWLRWGQDHGHLL